MAWDGPRRQDPLPRTLGQPILFVDELDFPNNPLELSECTQEVPSNMHAHLSPIEEERRFVSVDAPLLVRVTAKFHDPAIRFTYDHTYRSSQSFTPTEKLCQAFLRRIEHCSKELVTRKDSTALHATQCLRKGPKVVRFELSFEVSRQGHSGVWAVRSFTSYQKHALTICSANEVLKSTHNIVGLFLRRHDKDFQWTDEPAREYFPDKPETFKPSLKGPLDLACVPRSLFIESRQAWEFVPGYSLELTFKSRNPARHPPDISRILQVDSEQVTPLNLGTGEDLLWQAYRALQDVLDQKKSSFDLEHANCDGFDGVADCDCQHFEENALNVELRIINNLGPMYDHLCRSLQSSLRLFTHPSGQDCDEFVTRIETRLQQFRNRTDRKIAKLNDFDLRIAELTGHGWHRKNAARFIIDGSQSHTRRSIQALLDRIRTGVSDALRGNDVAIRMIAYKRGHLILDKALVARDHNPVPPEDIEPAEYQQHLILAELERRIQQDIDMVCEDTCELDGMLEEEPRSEAHNRRPRCSFTSSRAFTPCDTSSQRSRQLRPGSPASFVTRPPTSPATSSRSPSRAFPLVPAKFGKKEWLSSRSLSNGHNGSLPLGADAQGLQLAAEICNSSNEEPNTDTSSTHSSLPALTESDTPSPDHSLLMTPSFGQCPIPPRHAMPSFEDFGPHHFSHSFMPDTLASSSMTLSSTDSFEDMKLGLLKQDVRPSGVSMTPKHPGITSSVPWSTPKAHDDDADSDEKTPLAHRFMQGTAEADRPEDAGTAWEIFERKSDNSTQCSEPGSILEHVTAGSGGSDFVPVALPCQNWPLYPVEEEKALDQASKEPCEVAEVPASIAACHSSDTLRSSSMLQNRFIDSIAEVQRQRLDNGHSAVSVKLEETTVHHAQPLMSTQFELIQPTISAKVVGQLMVEDKVSRFNKSGSVKHDKDQATYSAMAEGSGLGNWMGKSERPDTNYVIPFSDSGIDVRTDSETTDRSGSECEERNALPPIDESASELNTAKFGTSSETSPIRLQREIASEPSGEEAASAVTKFCLMEVTEVPESPSEGADVVRETPMSALAPALASAKLPKVRTSDPVSRSISNAQHAPLHCGLSSAHLLPSLPIFSAFRSVSHETRASWTTSSSWEDYDSTARQSIDSVDTMKLSPTSSEEDEPSDLSKRLGTPTAGLLGLNESRWVNFGIRTALTSTYPSDRPSAASVPGSPESSGCDLRPDLELQQSSAKVVRESFSPPRKLITLKQRKSISSIIMATNLKRKESRDLKKQKSIEMKSLKKIKSMSRESDMSVEDKDGRFPKVMILVAGLAFASSMVSRTGQS